jgi:hypothetical protein
MAQSSSSIEQELSVHFQMIPKSQLVDFNLNKREKNKIFI